MPCNTSFVKINFNKIKPFIYFLTILLSINSAHAIDYDFRIYDNKNGFTSPDNIFVFSDDRSILWSSGPDGLTKYNGKTFTNYSKDLGLNDSQINCIVQKKNRELVCGTRKGVSIFDGNHFRNIGFKISKYEKKNDQYVRSLFISKHNEIYAGTSNGLFKLDSKANCFVRISPFKKLIRKISSDSFGNIYYTTKTGLFVIKNGVHKKVKITSKNEELDVSILRQIKGNLYWAGTTNGFAKVKYINGSFTTIYKHGDDFINDIIKLKSGEFVFIGNIGNVYLSAKNKIIHYNLSEIIYHLNIVSVTEDYQGNIWFATSLGLIKMFPTEVKRSDYTVKMKSSSTSFVKAENGIIYFGTPDGLIKIHGTKIEKFKLSSLSEDNFITALTYQDNQLLVGTISNKVYKFKDGKFELIFHSPQLPTCIYKILNPSKNEYWIAASNDVFHIVNSQKYHFHISDQYTQDIYLDKMGKLWFANMASIGYIQNGKIHRLNTIFKKYDNFVTIAKDKNDVMWIGSYGSGILRYSKGKIKAYTVKDGLTNNFVSSTFYDPKTNILWVGTMYGVSKIMLTKSSNVSSISNHINGENIESYGCIQNAICKLNDGTILFGVGEEIFEFKPSKQKLDYSKFKLLLSSILVNRKDIKLRNQISNSSNYSVENVYHNSFEYDHNNFDFNFSAIDFHSPHLIKYSWKLIGYDKDWTNYSDHDYVSYTNLPSGEYILQIRAINQSGQNSNVITFHFTIKKPFYLEWWFITLSSIFILFTTYLYFKFRIRKIQSIESEKTENYKRLAEAELKSLRSQMNPHFMFNTLNAIQEIVLTGNEEMTRIYFAEFAKMMRMILSNSAERFISLEREIDFLHLYLEFEQIRFQDKFKLNFRIDPNIETHSIKIPGMLLQPIIENAINHGLMHKENNGILDIHFYEMTDNQIDFLICIIQDNGLGIGTKNDPEQSIKNHRSMSSEITKERIAILNSLYGENSYNIQISDTTDFEDCKGTKVVLTIKIN